MRTKALENHHSSSFWMSTQVKPFCLSLHLGAGVCLVLQLLTSFGKTLRSFAKSPVRKLPARKLALPALGLLLALISLSSFSHSAYAAYSASVSRTSSGTVRLAESGGSSIKPSSTGTLGTGSDTVTVTSNCTAGYNLYVSGVNGGSTNLNRSGASTTELADASNYIASTSTATGSESTLTKDTWGVGKDGKTFSKLPAYNSDTSTLTALYSGTGDANNTAKNYTIYYGANVSTAKTPGTYTGDVLYTVVMNSSCQKWTLNFNGNSATTNNLTSQELAFDATINLADISSSSKIARTGYTLTGWTDQLGNSYGTSGIVDVNQSDAASVTLTAQWQINSHSVSITRGTNVSTVTATDGTNTKTNTTLTADYNKTITISATAFSAGYHFSGWTINSGGITLYSNSTMTTQSTTSTPAYFKMPDTDVTLTANAAANTYTIKFNGQGGSVITSQVNGTYGGSITSSAASYSGYNLVGWSHTAYTAGQGTATYKTTSTTSLSVSTLASAANATGAGDNGKTINLYAVWESSGPTNEGDKGTMQSFKCSSLGAGNYATVTDSRDNNKYVIKKLADGKCWMVQNLRLVGSKKLIPSTSDVSSSFTLSTSTSTPSKSTWCMDDNSTCDDKSRVYYVSSEVSDSSKSSYYGALYNWYAATAGTGTYSASSGNATSSICPKGWRLPTGGASGEFVSLDKAWDGTGTNRSGANTYSIFTGDYTGDKNGGFGLAGYIAGSVYSAGIYSVGSHVGYWSSTASADTYAYYLELNDGGYYTTVGPQADSNKHYGYSVRCIASS